MLNFSQVLTNWRIIHQSSKQAVGAASDKPSATPPKRCLWEHHVLQQKKNYEDNVELVECCKQATQYWQQKLDSADFFREEEPASPQDPRWKIMEHKRLGDAAARLTYRLESRMVSQNLECAVYLSREVVKMSKQTSSGMSIYEVYS